MKILVITQKIDTNDPVLGFFHDWVAKLSSKFDFVNVICLEKGEYYLPDNVKIFSLGKEDILKILYKNKAYELNYRARNFYKIGFLYNFYKYIWRLRNEYDAVFVHMNQEYVLLGGVLWTLLNKKIFLWRNHPSGNILTRIAVFLSDKVFCTSTHSFTARFKKTILMPVGVDATQFKIQDSKLKNEKNNNILFLSRMDKIKRPDLLIEALGILDKQHTDFTCDFYGDPTKGSEAYYMSLKERVVELGLSNKVHFYSAVSNRETPAIYASHEIFVNLTPTGSMDKTIVEACASECLPVVANQALLGELGDKLILKNVEADTLAQTLQDVIMWSSEEKDFARRQLLEYANKHSLDTLIEKLYSSISND